MLQIRYGYSLLGEQRITAVVVGNAISEFTKAVNLPSAQAWEFVFKCFMPVRV